MFLIHVSPEQVSSWKEETFKNLDALRFYRQLNNGEFELYFSYDPVSQSLLYEAIKKEGEEYHSLLVSLDRQVRSLGVNSSYIFAFALYLHEKESQMEETQLKEIYSSSYEDISLLSSYSYEDAICRQSMLPLFKELTSALTVREKKEQVLNTEEKLSFAYSLRRTFNDTFVVSLSAGNEKMRIVKNTATFIDSYRMSSLLSFYRDSINVLPEMIQEKDKIIFSLLSSNNLNHQRSTRYIPSKDADEVILSEKGVCLFLSALKGRELSYQGKVYSVEEGEITPTISILSDGSFALHPEIRGELFLADKNGALIDERLKKIILLSFTSLKEAAIYHFSYLHPDFRYDLFQKEISDNIVPLLSQSVAVDESFAISHPSKKIEIRYYVTYSEEDELLFKSEFYMDEDMVDEETFASHPVGSIKLDQFRDALSFLSLPENGRIKDEALIMSFLKMDLMPLRNTASVFLSENLTNKKIRGVGKINVSVKSGIDWLEMEMGSDIYSREDLELILSAYHKKKKYVRLHSSFISFDEEESRQFKELVDEFDIHSLQTERLPIYDALKLSTYSQSEVEVLYSHELKQLFDDIASFEKEEVDLDLSIEEELRPYQLSGVKWLHVLSRHNLSGILADDMGLGKTLEMIALLSTSKSNKPILIVSPKSLIYNWEYEFKKWNNREKVYVIDGNKTSRSVLVDHIDPTKREIYITSYDSLRKDLEAYEKISFSYLVLDEGQNIANVYAKKTRAVKELAADHKFVLTGTPIQNSLMDLWSIFDFLMPGYLPSYTSFYHTYGKSALEDEEEKERLMKKIMPFVLKRNKSDVLKDLPPKEEKTMLLGMSESQRELYDVTIQKARQDLSDNSANRLTILAEITRLREICVDPSIFIDNFNEVSEKLMVAMDTIKNAIVSHKVLVFSTFASTLFHLRELLQEEGIPSLMIYGETSAKDRLYLADTFNTTDEYQVMLVSLKAGGTGLNLIGADIVLHLDPWWNLAAENQASDRAHRIGQTRPVTIIKLVCKDSIEERVIQLQQMKKELSLIIQEGDEGIRSIDSDDLAFLLE